MQEGATIYRYLRKDMLLLAMEIHNNALVIPDRQQDYQDLLLLIFVTTTDRATNNTNHTNMPMVRVSFVFYIHRLYFYASIIKSIFICAKRR